MANKMAKRNRKRRLGAEDKAVFEWEKDRILPENLRDEMETMWEIPQVYHFLQLTKEAFNITHLSMYEVERMLLMPKASKQLAHIMTGLLSSPSTTKSKLHKVPPMPYEFWTNILMYKLKSWFKIYQTKHQDTIKVFDTLGIEPEFWKIFPDADQIEGKDFQDFSFKQRVWLLKSICDTAMYSRKGIQEEIAKQPLENHFETVLGMDRYGARYIYFPQFLHNDLRVYRLCLDNKVLSSVKAPVPEKPKEEFVAKEEEPKAVPRIVTKRKKRRSRWSTGSLPMQKKKDRKKFELSGVDPSLIDSNSNSVDGHFSRSSTSSSKASEMSNCSFAKSSGYETNISREVAEKKSENNDDKDPSEPFQEENTSSSNKEEDKDPVEELDKSTPNQNEEPIPKENSVSTVDDLSKSSKTDDEKLEEISSKNATKTTEKQMDMDGSLQKDVNVSKSDDEKLSESKKCDTSVNGECLTDEASLDKWTEVKDDENSLENSRNFDDDEQSDSELSTSGIRRSARIKHISEIKLEVEDAKYMEDMLNGCESEELCSIKLRDKFCSSRSFDDDEHSDSEMSSSGIRRSARIKHISEIKLEVEDAKYLEEMLNICEGEELCSIELRDKLCRVSSPEIEMESNGEFDENEWKVDDFEQLITNLSVSSFQLVADSLDSLKDLTNCISSDKTVPGFKTKKEPFIRPICEKILLKRMKILSDSLENIESILKESTKKARYKLQREWSNFENGVVEEDQEGAEEGSNRWLVGPQGLGPDHPLALPQPPVPRVSAEAAELQPQPQADSAGLEPAPEATQRSCSETEEEKAAPENQCQEEETPSQGNEGTASREKEGEEKAEEEREPEQPKRVLRTRGISSYTEQFFSDEDSEEEKLDGWTDIEAIYATPSAQVSASTPNTPTKVREPADDSEEEDSDLDWILPSSRKRKSKRPSASRRLKSFQHKLQNIKVDQEVSLRQHSSLKVVTKAPPTSSHTKRPMPDLLPASAVTSSAAASSVAVPSAAASSAVASAVPLNPIKNELQDPKLHSVLDIKDEGPIYDTSNQNVGNSCVQSNYVVVSTGQAPVANYYVMQQNPPVTAVVQQNQFIQPTAFVSQVVPPQVQSVSTEGYYVQQNPAQNYIVQNSTPIIAGAPQQAFIASTGPQVVYQQQPQFVQTQPSVVQTAPNYVQYVATTPQHQQQTHAPQPRIINTTTLAPPRQIAYRMRAPIHNNRMPLSRPNFPHPNGAVIRSSPILPNVLRPGQRVLTRPPVPKRQGVPRMVAPANKNIQQPIQNAKATVATTKGQKTTSLIVLSDSDDEIEMIVTEKSSDKPLPIRPKPAPVPAGKPELPAQLLQRMNEGNISLSPIKPAPTVVSQATQLVVVVNETGSHYALALPNGGKLILTPEQVAQIRASNGGKLVL